MEYPYLLSPPSVPVPVPVPGATGTPHDTVKVMVFHGIVYSHGGVSDPAIMPEYVAQVRAIREKDLSCAVLDPELPIWETIRNRLKTNKWDVGDQMQAYVRPTGNERSMILNAEAQKWKPAPIPEKGETAGEKKKSTVRLERGPGVSVEEPKAKKGSAVISSQN